MSINFKYTTLLIIIISGFLIFLLNTYKLKDKNILSIKEIKPTKTNINSKDSLGISINEINNFSNAISEKENNIKFTEKIVMVKKGQTFTKILEDFNFENKKKFKIINSINKIFNLRELKVDQKILFLEDEKGVISKIIIELDYNTNLIVDLSTEIEIKKQKLEIFSEIYSNEYFIKKSLYADGVKNNIPTVIRNHR